MSPNKFKVDFMVAVILFETDRLSVRQYLEEDIHLVTNFLTNSQETRLLGFKKEELEVSAIRGMMETCIASYQTDNPYHWYAVTEKNINTWIGQFGFAQSTHEVEVNYSIAPEKKGLGFASECLKAGIQFLSSSNPRSKIVAYIHPENKASVAVANKCGMSSQGIVKLERSSVEQLRYVYTP